MTIEPTAVATDVSCDVRSYLCKHDHFHGLTLCWHEREAFAPFSPPDGFDRRLAIDSSTRDDTA